MPEIRDIYDSAGEKTGRTFIQGESLQPGDYYLHTIILIMGRDGRFLLQQRALDARYYPGQWDATGGGVASAESSREAAAREAFEELGIAIDPDTLVFGGRIKQQDAYWLDMYGARVDITEADCRIDRREVHQVRMEAFDAFEKIVSYNKDESFMALQRRTHALLTGE